MEEKENLKTNELKLQIGDYVTSMCIYRENLSQYLKVHLRLLTPSVRRL
jgi:hypothetical protein